MKLNNQQIKNIIKFVGSLFLLIAIFSFVFIFIKGNYYYKQEVSTETDSISSPTSDSNAVSNVLTQMDASHIDAEKVPEWKVVTSQKYGYKYMIRDDIEYSFQVDTDLSTSTLAKYAQKMWHLNTEDKHPEGKETSQLEKIIINEREAYQFTVGHSYVADELGKGFTLSSNNNKFTFLETDRGVKVVINYPAEGENVKLFNEVINSFTIDDRIIPNKPTPGNWEVLHGQGFSLSIPRNIFTESERSTRGEDEIYYYRNPLYGGFFVEIKNQVFDPSRVDTFGGPIDLTNKPTISLGGKKAYKYVDGDAGCHGKRVLTSLSVEKTIIIGVGSCFDDVFPLMEEDEMFNSILETFKFTDN